jgi:flagellar protein FlaI
VIDRLWGTEDTDTDCSCCVEADGSTLWVDAGECPGEGSLEASPPCRARVAAALARSDCRVVVTTANGTERRYEAAAADLLTAAGRAAVKFDPHDSALAERTRTHPLSAAQEASGRAGPVGRIAAETGLDRFEADESGYSTLLSPLVGSVIGGSRVGTELPQGATLLDTWAVETGSVVRRYMRPEAPVDLLFLEPPLTTLSQADRASLATAADHLVTDGAPGGPVGPDVAVQAASAETEAPPDRLADSLRKHTQGLGVLEDLFAVPGLTDIFAPAPVSENDLTVRLGGETLTTNVRLTEPGAEALASRLRRTSGRAFSRATPTLDAGAQLRASGERIRVAAVTDPVSEGPGFAARTHATEPWTLPRLVSTGTLSAEAAALLSVSVERGAAMLVAGARGAGKTTLLGALLWELPEATRLVALEDTPELPVTTLQEAGRDVQSLRTDGDHGLDAAGALRTALRLGEGALVVGEVRGSEARVLYEAMRVGANASAVLGTIHGDGVTDVRERVTDDLEVDPAAFAATDLVVTCELEGGYSGSTHRISEVAEVLGSDDGADAALFETAEGNLEATGRIQRGNSDLLASLARPTETYSDVLRTLATRRSWLSSLAEEDLTGPEIVVREHARRRASS